MSGRLPVELSDAAASLGRLQHLLRYRLSVIVHLGMRKRSRLLILMRSPASVRREAHRLLPWRREMVLRSIMPALLVISSLPYNNAATSASSGLSHSAAMGEWSASWLLAQRIQSQRSGYHRFCLLILPRCTMRCYRSLLCKA